MLSCPYSLSVFGGVQGQVLGLAHALRLLGVDARIIAPCDGPPPEPGITSVGYSTRLPSNGSVAPVASGRAVARRTLEAIRSFTPDVLHLHEPLTPGSNHAALMGTTIPAVGTFHSARAGRNGWYEAFRSPLKGMMRRLARRTAVSDEAQRQVELTFGVKCEIVPNGIEITDFAIGDVWPAPKPAILFVGRHEPRKGLEVLLDAFERLDRDAVLWVVGDGAQTESLRSRGYAHVEWLGRVSDAEKQARLRGASVACFPSLDGESFGLVLLEAMAAGTALVASDIDGYRMVSRNGREAILVPPGDAEILSTTVRDLLDRPARRAELVAAGRARADEFSMVRLAERFLGIYEEAISEAPVPRSAAGRAL
ncbi:MAG: glycosyltransferase family 4 protein [Acidimicrobiia bacterium]